MSFQVIRGTPCSRNIMISTLYGNSTSPSRTKTSEDDEPSNPTHTVYSTKRLKTGAKNTRGLTSQKKPKRSNYSQLPLPLISTLDDHPCMHILNSVISQEQHVTLSNNLLHYHRQRRVKQKMRRVRIY
jgi:hypothetical protein